MLLISIVFSVTVYSALSSRTEVIEKVSSSGGESCYEKILGYSRIGAYQDKETIKLALSYCNPHPEFSKYWNVGSDAWRHKNAMARNLPKMT
jgi:hypothetical protein